MLQYYTPSGIGPLTHKQAITLVKIIAWASKHDDCDVTKDEAMNLCSAIQYFSGTSLKEGGVDMGDREEDKRNTGTVHRLDIWFISNKLFKSTKRVTFRRRTIADINDIVGKAKDIVELFRLYDDFQFAVSNDVNI